MIDFYIQVYSWRIPGATWFPSQAGHAGLSIVDSQTGEIVFSLDAGPDPVSFGVLPLPGENDGFFSAIVNNDVTLSPGGI
jgi:hypothetical protein